MAYVAHVTVVLRTNIIYRPSAPHVTYHHLTLLDTLLLGTNGREGQVPGTVSRLDAPIVRNGAETNGIVRSVVYGFFLFVDDCICRVEATWTK